MRALLTFLPLCLQMATATAQPATPLEPIVRATVDPVQVVVGQQTTLHVEVLAPNYLTKPPVLPDFQMHNSVTLQPSARNASEQQGGTTFAGVVFEFPIFPQEPGFYALSGETVTITYAADPPNAREVKLAIPTVGFEAMIPAAAESLDPFVAASGLQLSQEVRQSSPQLKVGDSVARKVTITAAGTPAMMLPPTVLTTVDRARAQAYPNQPILQDKRDPRSGTLTATRVDEATYVLQQQGDFTMPGIDVTWWNVKDQKIDSAHVDSITLRVAENPAVDVQTSGEHTINGRRLVLFFIEHWLAALVAASAAIACIWTSPRVIRATRDFLMKRRVLYRQSEVYAYARMRRTLREGDATKSYGALLGWLLRFEPTAPAHTISALKNVASNPLLEREIAAIERYLFSGDHLEIEWTPRPLLRQIAITRRLLLRYSYAQAAAALPPALNPTAIDSSRPHIRRPVAR